MKGTDIMFFKKNKQKVNVNIETLKLRINMVDCLLEHKFSWEEISNGLGFGETWYSFAKKLIEKNK